MTPAARLREMSRAASPAPWLTDEPANWRGLLARVCTAKYEAICPVDLSGWGRRRGLANAALIVALRNDAEKYADLVEAAAALVALHNAPWHSQPDMEGAQDDAVAALRAALAALGGGA